MPSQPPDTEHVVNIHRITPSNQKIPIDGLDANENTCTKTSLSQEPPRALESSQRKRSVVTININPRAATAREIARCKSPQKKLESDELRDDVEMSRRRRLLVVSIDSSSSLLFKTHGATVPRKPPRMASSAIIACVESSPTYQPGQSQRARGVLRRLVSLH